MRAGCVALFATLLCLSATWAHAQEPETILVSAARDGRSAGRNATAGGISTTGRFVAFDSRSSDIVKGDTNHAWDVFLWDRATAQTIRVNVSSDGEETNVASCPCGISSRVRAMSDDGTLIGFTTTARGLDDDDRDLHPDGFLHDTTTGETQMVTGNRDQDDESDVSAVSADGRFVVYTVIPDAGDPANVYVWDRKNGGRTWINRETTGGPPFFSRISSISANGDRLTFVAHAPEVGQARAEQVFVLDRTSGTISQVSVSSDEEKANNTSGGGDMSPDGRFVVFSSRADNLVGVGGDTNLRRDVFLRDLDSGTTSLVSVGGNGVQAFLGDSGAGHVSDDGCRVVFESSASDLVSDDTNNAVDAFVRDMCAETTTRVSVASDGSQSNRPTGDAFISGDGAWVTFQTRATNLSPEDGTGQRDVFLRGPLG